MKKRLQIVLPLIIVIIASTYMYKLYTARENGSSLKFSGNIEVNEAQMSFRIPGRLLERLVDEGERVKKGQPLAKLEKDDQEIAVAKAEANLDYAKAVLAELEAGSRQEDIARADARVVQAEQTLTELQNGSRSEEIEGSRAELERAKAAEQSAIVKFNQAQKDIDRYSNLYKQESVSKNVLEISQTLFDTAESQVQEAKARTRTLQEQLTMITAGPRIEKIRKAEATLKQVKAEYDLVKAGPRQESIDQARAKVQIAVETVNQARQQLSYTELLAPMDGVILTTSAEPGEYLNPATPVLTLGQIKKPWLRAYITETSLGLVKLNQEVTVSTDSYPDKNYTGRLSFISSQAEFTPKTVQTFEERVKLMFRIKVNLDNPDNELKPGMPADGIIDLAQ
jgi:HlyD family secretion protein